MEVVAGFLAAVILVLSPFSRGRGFQVECVGEPGCDRITGVADILEQNSQVNLLIVHGMGADKDTDYEPFTREIASHLNLYLRHSSDELVPAPSPAPAPAQIFTRIYVSADGSRSLNVYELHWWHLIQYSKSRLLADERHYPGRRARVNRELKSDLINERLADPIIYLGPLREPILWVVTAALCTAAGGEQSPEGCSATRPDVPTVIVTESLGSDIVFRALKAHGDLLATYRASTPQIFMLANQLPLLGLANEEEELLAPLKTFTEPGYVAEGFVAEGYVEQGIEPQIVAVSDPSDLLSYPLPESVVEEGWRFVNVLRPFGRRLLAGLVVEPIGAHTGAIRDQQIREMIACGRPSRCRTSPTPTARRGPFPAR